MATQTTPQTVTGRQGSLDGQGLFPTGEVHWNLIAPELIQHAVRRGEGQLADMGPFCAVTAPHTGRSPNDKFVVKEPGTEADVDWGKVNQPISPAHFETLREDVKRYLNEQPELFVEISPELAREKNIANLDMVRISTPRAAIDARALVTGRLRPFTIGGQRVHQVGMPWHWGYQGVAQGAIVNSLSSLVMDPNVSMHEGKAFVCNVEKV